MLHAVQSACHVGLLPFTVLARCATGCATGCCLRVAEGSSHEDYRYSPIPEPEKRAAPGVSTCKPSMLLQAPRRQLHQTLQLALLPTEQCRCWGEPGGGMTLHCWACSVHMIRYDRRFTECIQLLATGTGTNIAVMKRYLRLSNAAVGRTRCNIQRLRW